MSVKTVDGATFAEKQSERDFAISVVETAELLGWLVKRDPTYRPTAAVAGFPDLVMCNGKRLIFVELKSKRGKETQEQRRWLGMLRLAGADARTWRPADWPEIKAVLKGEA